MFLTARTATSRQRRRYLGAPKPNARPLPRSRKHSNARPTGEAGPATGDLCHVSMLVYLVEPNQGLMRRSDPTLLQDYDRSDLESSLFARHHALRPPDAAPLPRPSPPTRFHWSLISAINGLTTTTRPLHPPTAPPAPPRRSPIPVGCWGVLGWGPSVTGPSLFVVLTIDCLGLLRAALCGLFFFAFAYESCAGDFECCAEDC